MKLSPSALLDHSRSDEGRKQIRYALVSVIFVPLGQVIVQMLHWTADWANYVSILVTACILTIPNYYANKIYVWRDTSKENLQTQIMVFWIAAMLGTGAAMALADLADHLTTHTTKLVQAIWLFIAQLGGYGVVWVGRYVFLDKLIFKATHHGDEPTEDELDELHHEFPV